MKLMKAGDLLLCIANTLTNPEWQGTLPEIGEYYVCEMADIDLTEGHEFARCKVEEIPIKANFYHTQKWYQVIESHVNIEQLLLEEMEA